MIGEGKHGLWRVQENGTVREYLKRGATGLPAGADPLASESQAIVARDYAAYLPDESWSATSFPTSGCPGWARSISSTCRSRIPSTRAATPRTPRSTCPTGTARCRRTTIPTRAR